MYNKMRYLLLLLIIPVVVNASGTTEQYTKIWLVIIFIIVAPILGFLYEKMNSTNTSEKKVSEEDVLNIKIRKKQALLNAKKAKESEKLKHKELLKKTINILHTKGYSIKTLKYGWRVTAPNGTGRNFYDIEFLYSYALVQ